MVFDGLRLLFEAGDLLAAEIVSAQLELGQKSRWSCQFRRRNGELVVLALSRKHPGGAVVRVFDSLDSAFETCECIGFRCVTVVSSETSAQAVRALRDAERY